MSTDLYWKPAPVVPEGARLPIALKYPLARLLWDHDGSLHGEPCIIGVRNTHVVGFLDGLAAAGVEGAAELAEAITKYGNVEVWIR